MGWRTAWDERLKRRTRIRLGDDQGRHIAMDVKDHTHREVGSKLTLGEKLTDGTLVGRLVRAGTRSVRVVVASERRQP